MHDQELEIGCGEGLEDQSEGVTIERGLGLQSEIEGGVEGWNIRVRVWSRAKGSE